MSWLLCMDESGHDHRNTPYEVRGGVALHAKNIWNFVQDMKKAEHHQFGVELSRYGSEIKGAKLLKQRRTRQYESSEPISDEERRERCIHFLSKGTGSAKEFNSYAQACIGMVDNIFFLLKKHDAKIFASIIPRGVKKPPHMISDEYLRKDHVFLLERFFYFLEHKQEHGILIMDETEKENDKVFVRKVEKYFTKTATGRKRTYWFVPTPFFVSSDMAYPVQAADVLIYCINWGFRTREINRTRNEFIYQRYGSKINNLQFKGQGYTDSTTAYQTRGIVYVPDPFTSRT